jgi:hypothetical protein
MVTKILANLWRKPMKHIRVLIACEYSGVIRQAFANLGFDAWSADLLPTEKEGNHYEGNVLDILHDNWHLMIAHPPCTYLSHAGLKYWNREGRKEKREDAYNFFLQLYHAPIKHICVENPKGYINTVFRPADQTIHPYYFGTPELKRTCLWLKNLPKLIHHKENNLFGQKTHTDFPKPHRIDIKTGKKRFFTDASNGWKARSKSFECIANAMAMQWGNFLRQNNP